MSVNFAVDLRIKEANDLTTKLLIKRGFRAFSSGNFKTGTKSSWLYFRDTFSKGKWNIGITSNIYIRDKDNKEVYLQDISIKMTPQIVNHYYNIDVITQKVSLTETLRAKVKGYEKFYPETFILRPGNLGDMSDLEKLFKKIKELKESKESNNSLWILKPSNLRCGQEIYLKKITDSDILDNIYEFIKSDKESDSLSKSYVIQKYISNPLLYQGRKFDVRVHVLVSSVDTDFDIYINPLSFVRTTSRPYTKELSGDWNIDKFIHLTNHSIQKYDTDFGKYEDHNVLLLENVEIGGVNLFEKFMPIWRDIIKDILESSKDLIKFESKSKLRSFYEFLGFDFIIDENFNTWLLEININPMVLWDNKEADMRMEKLIDDLFKIVIDPKFKNLKSKDSNSWVQI